DILVRMPGINFKNYKLLMNKVENLQQLSKLSENELGAILQSSKHGSTLFNFIHKKKVELVGEIQQKKKIMKTSSYNKYRKRH
ncbi:unnamed protein product, partial [Didymodactylos carnosus]